MKSVSGKQLCKALEQKGWQLSRITSSHHIKGMLANISVPVHENQDLKPGALAALLKLSGLSEKDL